jgi:hypothetical protein
MLLRRFRSTVLWPTLLAVLETSMGWNTVLLVILIVAVLRGRGTLLVTSIALLLRGLLLVASVALVLALILVSVRV